MIASQNVHIRQLVDMLSGNLQMTQKHIYYITVIIVIIICRVFFYKRTLYTPCLKKLQTYLLSEVCQISTDCENFWHKDSREDKLF